MKIILILLLTHMCSWSLLAKDKVIFEAYENNNWELFVADADGKNLKNLTNTPDIHEHYPQISPDGKKVAFIHTTGEGDKTKQFIYYMDINGKNLVKVAFGREMAWSADSQKIAFIGHEFKKRFNGADYASKGAFLYDLKSKEIVEFKNKKIHHLYNPNLTPDGKWLISTVHGGMGFGHAIIAIEVEGEKVIDLKLHGCRPDISSDGKMVTWSMSDKEIGLAKILYNENGEPYTTEQRVLHKEAKSHTYHPDFSKNGEYIIFSLLDEEHHGKGKKGKGIIPGISERIGGYGPWKLVRKRLSPDAKLEEITKDSSKSSKEADCFLKN